MFLESIQRHLAVCGRADLPRMAKADPNFWNVVSIGGPTQPPINPRGFKQIHRVICYDVGGTDPAKPDDTLGIPRKEHLAGIFRFADALTGEPLLIHCQVGVSRSTAVALCLIVRAMHADGFALEEIREQAADLLLAIRPQAAPNPLILELGLAEFLPAEARSLTAHLLKNPALLANRIGEPLR